MVDQERYRCGAHTVTGLKYRIVWKAKDGYPILRGAIGLWLQKVLRMISGKQGMVGG